MIAYDVAVTSCSSRCLMELLGLHVVPLPIDSHRSLSLNSYGPSNNSDTVYQSAHPRP
jgi:hypothetical protein